MGVAIDVVETEKEVVIDQDVPATGTSACFRSFDHLSWWELDNSFVICAR